MEVAIKTTTATTSVTAHEKYLIYTVATHVLKAEERVMTSVAILRSSPRQCPLSTELKIAEKKGKFRFNYAFPVDWWKVI